MISRMSSIYGSITLFLHKKIYTTVEMYAYTAHLKESGKGSFEDTVLKAAVAKSVQDAESNSGTWNFSEKVDWVKVVNDIMQSAYCCGDMKGYMEWKKFLDLLEN